ncbi:MAG TPA: NAD(P)-binding domain-containing protein, partial [Pyrinomonadaceae bacterium]|nr:NAD(P)-binding domain-containing protein [Pyrinomonadaceae bacterium]
MKISIIGVGKLGGALAVALSMKGFEIENLLARNSENAKKIAELVESKPKIIFENEFAEISSGVILITTQDFEIENVAQKLKENLRHKPTVFHTSGSLSSDVLKNLKTIGCKVGSIHPLASISDAS